MSDELKMSDERRIIRYAERESERSKWMEKGRYEWTALEVALEFPKEVAVFGAELRKRKRIK